MKFTLTLLLFLIMFSAISQDYVNRDYRDKEVKSVTNSHNESTYYDKEGKLILGVYKDFDIVDTTKYYYNSRGKLKFKLSITRDYGLKNKSWDSAFVFYRYDINGFLVSDSSINGLNKSLTIYNNGNDSLPDSVFTYNNSINPCPGCNSTIIDTFRLKGIMTYNYNQNGWAVGTRDFLGDSSIFEYDSLGNMVFSKRSIGQLRSGCIVNNNQSIEIENIKYNGNLEIQSIEKSMSAIDTTVTKIDISYKFNRYGLVTKRIRVYSIMDTDQVFVRKYKWVEKYKYSYFKD